jgi:hypothetical protein
MIRELYSKQNIDFMEACAGGGGDAHPPGRGEARRRADVPVVGSKGHQRAGLSGVWIRRSSAARAGRARPLPRRRAVLARLRRDGRGLRRQRLGSFPILLGGTEEQKQRWLPGIASGDKLISFGLSEKDAGS